MKKKFLLFIAIVIVLFILDILYDIFIGAPTYENIDEFIASIKKAEYVDVIESKGYYLVLEQYPGNDTKHEILFYNEDGRLSLINSHDILLKNSKWYRYYFMLEDNYYGKLSIIEHNQKYLIIPYISHSKILEDRPYKEYIIMDENGEWESIEANKYGDDHYTVFWFNVVTDIEDYDAYIQEDEKEYKLISEEDIIYLFDNNLSQSDVDDNFFSQFESD